MRSGEALVGCMLAGWLAALSAPAAAVIRVDMPVSKIYGTADAVAVGTVVAVTADSRVVEVKITHALKGRLNGDRLRVQIAAPAGLIKHVAAGAPVVIFATEAEGKALAVLHLADTWCQAEGIAGARPPAWRVGHVPDLKQSFPGRTAALAAIVRQLKAGKYAVLDKLETDFFQAGVRELAKLNVVKPTFLSAADVNADGKSDLLVGLHGGVRLLLAGEAGFADVTGAWGLEKAAGPQPAFGDVNGDGKADLLLGSTVWINDGRRFADSGAALALPADARVLCAALADVSGDGKPDAAVLLADGRLVTFENPGAAGKPWPRRPVRALWKAGTGVAAAFGDWGDDGRPHVMVVRSSGITRHALGADSSPPADEERLTGKRLLAYYAPPRGTLSHALAARLDANGDRRPDLFLFAQGRGLLLVNRGFGAFLVSVGAGQALISHERRRLPFELTPATPWAAADLHADGRDDLLVLTQDGRLYVVSNRPQPTRPK